MGRSKGWTGIFSSMIQLVSVSSSATGLVVDEVAHILTRSRWLAQVATRGKGEGEGEGLPSRRIGRSGTLHLTLPKLGDANRDSSGC